ncbi:hypothetical protein POTOM_057092 [Populus tomentosa]|uniref:Uncharacterized protein n=1 Tax=Populus tomentosa TaxID=118781 RepID=A0A8X8C4M3_POPTO|nr:hypothetical protein POTOM_057092 [Populus tomentosa]
MEGVFEQLKQFRKQNVWREPEQDNEGSSQRSAFAFVDEAPANVPDGSQNELASQYQNEQSSADEKRKSVHEWILIHTTTCLEMI